MSDSSAVVKLQLQNQASPELKRTAADVRALTIEEAKLAVAQDRAARSALQVATSEQRLSTATSQATAAKVRAEAATLRLSQAQERAAKGGGSLAQSFRGIQTALATAGFAIGIQQIVQFGTEATQAALSLRETKNALRAVAQDAATYRQVLATAREQQLLFGGSLQENIEGLSGLTITARQSGASLKTLVDLSQRLNVLSPEQGPQGARIALAEALSGNIASLSRRFEIPRSALAGLTDETKSITERLAVLDQFLNKVGVTSASVAGKVDQDALAFRALAAELENVKIQAGEAIVGGLSPAAQGLTNILRGDFSHALDGANTRLLRFVELLSTSGGAAAGIRKAVGEQGPMMAILAGATDEASRALEQFIAFNQSAGAMALRVGGAFEEERAAAAALGRELRANLGLGADTTPRGRTGRSLVDPSTGHTGGAVAGFGGGARGTARSVLGRANEVRQSELDLAYARARTSAQRIAILKQELATTADVAERNRILARIEGERQSGAKAHTSELDKQLTLAERTRDAEMQRYKAALDASEAAIRDRQERRKEDQEIATAQRIIASGRASTTFKAAAQDALALIAVHRQQRALDISEKTTTAGGAVAGGRLLQSVPGQPPTAAPAPLATSATATPGAVALPGGGTATINVYIGNEPIDKRIEVVLGSGIDRAQTSGAGRLP